MSRLLSKSRLLYGLIILLGFLQFDKVAQAQESYCFERGSRSADAYPCMRSGDTLYINGEMHFDVIYYELRNFDQEKRLKRVELNSTGGNIREMEIVAELINKRNMSTHVRGDSVCMSACTLLYQAGVQRTAEEGAQFLYHTVRNSPTYGAEVQKQCTENGNTWCENKTRELEVDLLKSTAEFFELLKNYGVTKSLFDDFYKLPIPNLEAEIAIQRKRGNFLLRPNLRLSATETQKYNIVQSILVSPKK